MASPKEIPTDNPTGRSSSSGTKPRVPAKVLQEPAAKVLGLEVESSYKRQLIQAVETFESNPTGPGADLLLKRIARINLMDGEFDSTIESVAERLVSAVHRIMDTEQKIATAGKVARTISFLASQTDNLDLSSNLSFTAFRLNPAEQWTEISKVINRVEGVPPVQKEKTGRFVAGELYRLRKEMDEDSWKRVSQDISDNLPSDSVVVSELAKLIEPDEPDSRVSPSEPIKKVNEESVVRKFLMQHSPSSVDPQGSVVYTLHKDRNGKMMPVSTETREEHERKKREAAEAKEKAQKARAAAQQAQAEAMQARTVAKQAVEEKVELQNENIRLVDRLLKKKIPVIIAIGAIALGVVGASLGGYYHIKTSPKVTMRIKDKEFKLADFVTEYPKKITPKKMRKYLNSMISREHIGLLDINQQVDIYHGVAERVTYMPDQYKWDPTLPEETLNNKNGNCKSIAVLLASLLESLGSKTILFFEWTREKGHVYVGVKISDFTKDDKAKKDAERALKIYYKKRAAKKAKEQVEKSRKKYRTKRTFDRAVQIAVRRADAAAERRFKKPVFKDIEPDSHSHLSKHTVGTYLVLDAAVLDPKQAFAGTKVQFEEVPNVFPVESVPGSDGRIPILL